MGTELQTAILDRSIPVPEAGCWLWLGVMNSGGYGRIIINGRQLQAHRISYLANKGDIGDGLLVCHKCDTRTCVNPDHLFLGTHQDNTSDMVNKGRCRSGLHMAAKTHCRRGHKYDDMNTSAVDGKHGKERACKKCYVINSRNYRARNNLKETAK